jgi:TetR/AcrR family transcriptional regulator, mexJK operon transcriptional repressor
MTLIAPSARLNRDERRDHILDVARECFLRHGYAGCSMSIIAARLGGSKGTLYNYFRSKEELFEAFVRRACGRFAENLSNAPSAEGDLRERLIHFARAFQTHLLSPDAIATQRLVVGEGERFPELGPLFYAAGPQIIIGRMSAEFAQLMDAGRIRRADPELAAVHFKDLAVSGFHWRRIWGVAAQPTEAELIAQATVGVDTFLRAYKPD